MLLIADRPFAYNGKQLEIGEQFEAAAQYANILIITRSAHPAPEKPKRKYKRRDMTAENDRALAADDYAWAMDNPKDKS